MFLRQSYNSISCGWLSESVKFSAVYCHDRVCQMLFLRCYRSSRICPCYVSPPLLNVAPAILRAKNFHGSCSPSCWSSRTNFHSYMPVLSNIEKKPLPNPRKVWCLRCLLSSIPFGWLLLGGLVVIGDERYGTTSTDLIGSKTCYKTWLEDKRNRQSSFNKPDFFHDQLADHMRKMWVGNSTICYEAVHRPVDWWLRGQQERLSTSLFIWNNFQRSTWVLILCSFGLWSKRHLTCAWVQKHHPDRRPNDRSSHSILGSRCI
jgi:hypothetical protein